MSTDYWMLEEDLCRCCHSEGTFQNLAGAFNFGDEEENMYLNMLRDTLDITISPVSGSLCSITFTICDTCVKRLRDATIFKKQVVCCEQKFNDLYRRNFIKLAEPDYKMEVKEEEPERDIENAVELRDDDSWDDSFDVQHDDDEESSVNRINQEGKKKAKKTPQKAKAKLKPKKPPKKCGRPRKVKDIKQEEAVGDKDETEDSNFKPVTSKLEQLLTQGGKVPKFRLLDDDYTKDGGSYACARCDKRYVKLISLKHHVKTKHYKIPRFVCPYCHKEFMTAAPLTVHKLQDHDIDDRFKCNACKGTFNTKVQLRKHINNFHMLGEKYKCDFCEYESFSFEGMYKHKFKHKTVKDYHCRYCRKSFLRKTTLDLHERIHTGDRRKVCAVCGQAFVQKASLNYHMNKYHPGVNF